MKTEVKTSRRITPDTQHVVLDHPEGFDFEAGQYAVVSVQTEDGLEVRPLSIASAPEEETLEFATRDFSSPFKAALRELDPGDRIDVKGPKGEFTLEGIGEDERVVLLCGGIGITPFRGILHHLDGRDGPDVTLVYSNRTPEDIAFREELSDLARRNRHIHVVYTLTEAHPDDVPERYATGRIDAEMLRERGVLGPDAVFFVCGPPGMVEDLTHLLADLGVSDDRIRTESFTGY